MCVASPAACGTRSLLCVAARPLERVPSPMVAFGCGVQRVRWCGMAALCVAGCFSLLLAASAGASLDSRLATSGGKRTSTTPSPLPPSNHRSRAPSRPAPSGLPALAPSGLLASDCDPVLQRATLTTRRVLCGGARRHRQAGTAVSSVVSSIVSSIMSSAGRGRKATFGSAAKSVMMTRMRKSRSKRVGGSVIDNEASTCRNWRPPRSFQALCSTQFLSREDPALDIS